MPDGPLPLYDACLSSLLCLPQARLTKETAKLAQGFDACCLFVNDDCGAEVRAAAPADAGQAAWLRASTHFTPCALLAFCPPGCVAPAPVLHFPPRSHTRSATHRPAVTMCPPQVLEVLHAGGVRFVAMRCAGYDRVDVEAAKRLGIRVVRVPTYSPRSVAEHAMALMFDVARWVVHAIQTVHRYEFPAPRLVAEHPMSLMFDVAGRVAALALLWCCLFAGCTGCRFAGGAACLALHACARVLVICGGMGGMGRGWTGGACVLGPGVALASVVANTCTQPGHTPQGCPNRAHHAHPLPPLTTHQTQGHPANVHTCASHPNHTPSTPPPRRNLSLAHMKVLVGNYTVSGLVGCQLSGKTFGVGAAGAQLMHAPCCCLRPCFPRTYRIALCTSCITSMEAAATSPLSHMLSHMAPPHDYTQPHIHPHAHTPPPPTRPHVLLQVVGTGNIGVEFIKLLRGFQGRVLAYDVQVRAASWMVDQGIEKEGGV